MNHRADGRFLQASAWRLCRKDIGLLDIITGKFHQTCVISVCPPRRIIKISSHTADMSGVTNGNLITLIMCRYSASSMFGTCNKLLFRGGQLGSRPVSAKLTFLEETRGKNILNGWRKSSSQQKASRSRDKYVRAIVRAATTTPKFIKIQLPESGNQRRLR